MIAITHLLYAFLTLLAAGTICYGVYKKSDTALSIGVWSSLLAIVLLYQLARGEILGLFFNYTNSILYSINIIIIIFAIFILIRKSAFLNISKLRQTLGSIAASIICLGGLVLLINVWINAYFIENRKAKSPILQVATLGKNPHCQYDYMFYKISADNKVSYLCPNKYGLFPGIGNITKVPAFLKHQLGIIGQG